MRWRKIVIVHLSLPQVKLGRRTRNRVDGPPLADWHSFDMITQLAGLTALDPGQLLGDRRTSDPSPPDSIVRMIVSATKLSGQALASDTGNLGGVVVECRNPNRHPPRPHLNSATRNHRDQPAQPRTLISEEPLNSWIAHRTTRLW